ncbi:MAG TPA: replication protein RepA [Candidatus Binataceae bacterium]|nr:replication protein RepA [Candidatus Binataceae bacterium]
MREWQRTQGAVSLLVKAGEAQNPHTKEWVKVGLPWGTKPRLILAHLNAEALRQDSPVIEIESSLTAFVKRIRGFQQGREIRMFKHQLTALSTAVIRLAMSHGDHSRQVNTQVISAFDLWLEKDDRQRVLWPSTIQLSLDYFESLRNHAIPLPEADLAALAHSAVALDLFAWLAQRLYRVHSGTPAFIAWAALKEQFGPDYGRMDHFKVFFRRTLKQVIVRYPKARVELDNRGLYAFSSPPPVTPQRRFSALTKRLS